MTLLIASASEYPAVAASAIAVAIEAAITAGGRCTLALAGGGTPAPVYQSLARHATIRWSAVDIFFGDERAVPPDDPASNFRMARESLLDRIAVSAECVHRMPADRRDRAAAAAEYDALLPASLDVLLLGMGEDGHTASLFPHSVALAELKRRVLAVTGTKAPVERLTITPPVIAAARAIFVLVRGSAKAAMVSRVIAGRDDPQHLPVQLARHATWLLDDDAAAALHLPGG